MGLQADYSHFGVPLALKLRVFTLFIDSGDVEEFENPCRRAAIKLGAVQRTKLSMGQTGTRLVLSSE